MSKITTPDYCKITSYIEFNNQPLHMVIAKLCAFGFFRTKGTKGLTFIEPCDKTLKDIIKVMEKDTHKAKEILKSHIIYQLIPSLDKFGDGFTNAARSKINVTTANSMGATLENGTKITKHQEWRPMADSKLAQSQIMYSCNGPIPDGQKIGPSSMGRKSGKTGRTSGRGEVLGGAIIDYLMDDEDEKIADQLISNVDGTEVSSGQLKKMIETANQILEQKWRKWTADKTRSDPYVTAVSSLLQFLEGSGQKQLAQMMKDVLSPSGMASWYMFMSPPTKPWIFAPKELSWVAKWFLTGIDVAIYPGKYYLKCLQLTSEKFNKEVTGCIQGNPSIKELHKDSEESAFINASREVIDSIKSKLSESSEAYKRYSDERLRNDIEFKFNIALGIMYEGYFGQKLVDDVVKPIVVNYAHSPDSRYFGFKVDMNDVSSDNKMVIAGWYKPFIAAGLQLFIGNDEKALDPYPDKVFTDFNNTDSYFSIHKPFVSLLKKWGTNEMRSDHISQLQSMIDVAKKYI